MQKYCYIFVTMETVLKIHQIRVDVPVESPILRIIGFRYTNQGHQYKDYVNLTNNLADFTFRDENNRLVVDFDYFKEDVVFIYFCLAEGLRIAFCDKTSKMPNLFAATKPQYTVEHLKVQSEKYMSLYLGNKERVNGQKYFDIISKSLSLKIINQTTENKFVCEILAESGTEPFPIVQEIYKGLIEITLSTPPGILIEMGKPYLVWIRTFAPWVGHVSYEIMPNQHDFIVLRYPPHLS